MGSLWNESLWCAAQLNDQVGSSVWGKNAERAMRGWNKERCVGWTQRMKPLGEFCIRQSHFSLCFRQQPQKEGGWLFHILDILINVCETEIMLLKYFNFILSIEKHFKSWARLRIFGSYPWSHMKSYSLYSTSKESILGPETYIPSVRNAQMQILCLFIRWCKRHRVTA